MKHPVSAVLVAAGAIALAAVPAQAVDLEAVLSPEFTACMEASGGVHFNMMDCIGQETEHQDALLNQRYRLVMAALEEAGKAALKDSQRKWIAYRDAECSFAYQAAGGDEGGQMAGLEAGHCTMSMTAHRAAELHQYIQQLAL